MGQRHEKIRLEGYSKNGIRVVGYTMDVGRAPDILTCFGKTYMRRASATDQGGSTIYYDETDLIFGWVDSPQQQVLAL